MPKKKSESPTPEQAESVFKSHRCCGNCDHWLEVTDQSATDEPSGDCIRFPPIPIVQFDEVLQTGPVTVRSHRCGEFLPRLQ